MPEEDNISFDDVETIFAEVCELTSDTCSNALNDYKSHNNKLKLVVDVFKAINDCKTEKCNTNKQIIYSKLNEFLKARE